MLDLVAREPSLSSGESVCVGDVYSLIVKEMGTQTKRQSVVIPLFSSNNSNLLKKECINNRTRQG